MNLFPKGQVTLPREPVRGADMFPWAKAVNTALQQLRDRVITAPSRPPARPPKRIDFEVYNIKEGATDWTCNVWPGHVLNIDPTYGATDPLKYWLPTELDYTPPALPTEFTVDETKQIYVKVETDDKDIITAATVVVLTEDATEHSQPPPSAADNGESPPPPLDGFYYYKIADFKLEDGVLKVDKQYHLGGPIIHRPNLPEFYNIPETGGTGYEVMKHWNGAESRYEMRQIVQMDETDSVAMLKPYGAGEPPYDQIPVRAIRERASGDDASTATTQIRVVASSSGNAAVVKGNGKVGKLTVTPAGGSPVDKVLWDDGLVTSEGTINIDIPAACSGYTGTIEILDVCGTFVHTITVSNGCVTNYEQVSV